uniref:Sialate O-acetylesterase domain-containing protein n=2 Tax=Odontella aurita TaxID=265563 RepID=A0A6U6FT91_9STRA|mmetsp:Transcript_37410/g.112130  ORF Transcript_37410/g.112130 Transcript_37410/m.112130 type:complete len:164 (+) Transcript_37410:887-1378(+)
MTLANLTAYFPSIDTNFSVKLSGFAWHQGWNDGCDAQMTAEYEFNLANLIRDLRVDFDAPNLPVSIGVSGMAGYSPGRRTDIVNAQFAVANRTKYPEFAGNVASVETRNYLREPKPHSPSDFDYHWNNNAESLWLVGEAMGKAMVEMVLREERRDARGTAAFS